MQIRFLKSLLVMAAAASLFSGCSGSGGGGGTSTTSTGTPVKVADLAPEQWAVLAPTAEVQSVTINSPPVVKFKVTDANGNPLVGLENNTTKKATDTVAANANVSFSLAKLVPGKNGSPSKWVNYIVTTVPTTTAAATATRPTTDNTGTLVGNGDGTYQYTFYRDITKIKDQVAAMTLAAPKNAADLGDLTYDPTLTHRLTIQISGNARNTGTNTADGSTSTSYPTAVRMANPLNLVYDFVPAGGAVTTKRDITQIAKCNECHDKLAIHGGGRVEARYCVVCHTDQRKFDRTNVASAAGVFGTAGNGYVLDGETQGDFMVFVHKIHAGKKMDGKTLMLSKSGDGYNYYGIKYGDIKYPQTALNCTKCHTKSDAAPQGDNWKTAPSRLACGSCHDGINFATGVGHIAQTSDANCKTCHDPGTAGDHVAAHKAKMPSNYDASLRTMSAQILGVTVGAADGKVTAKFKVTDNGVAVTDPAKFAAPTFMLVKLVKNAEGTFNWVGYTNQYNTKNAAMAPVLQTKGEKNGTLVANADGTFSYTFALSGATAGDIRTVTHAHNVSGNATLSKDTAGTYSSYNGDLTNWGPAVELAAPVTYEPTKTHRVAMTSSKVATAPANTGFNAWFDFVPAGGAVTETRDIVKTANCANCHANGKLHAAFDIQVCVTCHNPSKDPNTGESVSLEYMIHKLHMGADLPSVKAGGTYIVNVSHDYSKAAFPGNIKNCLSCHSETTGNINGANWRTNPTAGACVTCHDGTSTVTHATTSGFANNCISCHGSGAARDAKVVHQ